MNREIKFRGKRIDNGEWMYGQLCQLMPQKNKDASRTWMSGKLESINWSNNDITITFSEVVPATIGQYAGLKDKSEVEIYEGDVVNYRAFAGYGYRGIVRFGEYEQDGSGDEYSPSACLGFYVERQLWIPQERQVQEYEEWKMPKYEKTISLRECDELEVIGNIHDNPELLEHPPCK